jgi:hypothetical protein
MFDCAFFPEPQRVITWGRCNDHNFLRFVLQFSAKKLAFYGKKQCLDSNLTKNSSSLNKKRRFFRKCYWRKSFQNNNIGPWSKV